MGFLFAGKTFSPTYLSPFRAAGLRLLCRFPSQESSFHRHCTGVAAADFARHYSSEVSAFRPNPSSLRALALGQWQPFCFVLRPFSVSAALDDAASSPTQEYAAVIDADEALNPEPVSATISVAEIDKCIPVADETVKLESVSVPDLIAEIDECICTGDPKQGRIAHAVTAVYENPHCNPLLTSALALMYGTCSGKFDEAISLFENLPYWDSVSLNVMIAVYSHNGRSEIALELLRQMISEGIKPCHITFSCVLNSCCKLESLSDGKTAHINAVSYGLDKELQVESALFNMYSKFLGLATARAMFNAETLKNEGAEAVRVSISAILRACGETIESYSESSKTPTKLAALAVEKSSEDLQEELRRLIETPAPDLESNSEQQKQNHTLSSSDRRLIDVDRGSRVAERVFELDPGNAAPHVLLSNIYAAAGRWEDVARVRNEMRRRGLKKQPGKSSIEIKNKIHDFVSGDTYHPERKAIYAELDRLMKQIEDAGYVPDTKTVLHDVDEDRKKHLLYHHSERLAIAYGLLNTPPGTPLRVIKNLRVCTDCHTASKFISKVTGRKLIMRDAKRFHHVEDGVCSCGDYW